MTAVYSSSESLTGDLEAYDDDAGVLQVYDAQARYLPLTWQAPDPAAAGPGRRAWVHRNRAGRTGSMMRCGGFLPLIGRADLAEAPVLDLQAAAQAISDHYGGPPSRPRWRWPSKGRKAPATEDPE
jgi:hypothetical protein